jgi:hypothetical protein
LWIPWSRDLEGDGLANLRQLSENMQVTMAV